MHWTCRCRRAYGPNPAVLWSPVLYRWFAQVLLRNGDALYVTDGVYGSLSDAGAPGFRFPARLLRPSVAATRDYMLFGPTCDSADRMAGPFSLPADVAEGDWIEIGQLGAYGACLRTGFNGFDAIWAAEVRDPPMLPI